VGGIRTGTAASAIRHLPGNKQAALTANLHAVEALVEAGNQASHTLGKAEGLGVSQFGFSVGAHFGLAVFVEHGLAGVVVRRIELAAVGSEVAGVLHLVKLVGGGVSAGAQLDVLVAQGEGRLDDAFGRGNAGGKLDG
jgi:hypothetical protein